MPAVSCSLLVIVKILWLSSTLHTFVNLFSYLIVLFPTYHSDNDIYVSELGHVPPGWHLQK